MGKNKVIDVSKENSDFFNEQNSSQKKSKKKNLKGKEKWIKRFSSISFCFFFYAIIMVFALVIVGVFGFILFLSSSISKSGSDRSTQFSLIQEGFDAVLDSPKTTIRAFAHLIEEGLIDIYSPYEEVKNMVYDTVKENFDFYGFEMMAIFVAMNRENDIHDESIVVDYRFSSGLNYVYRSWFGWDSVNSTEYVVCVTDANANCINTTTATIERGENTSVYRWIQNYTDPHFFNYLYCPDVTDPNNVCYILIAYSIPIRNNNSEFIGSAGFFLTSNSIGNFLLEVTKDSDFSFVVDVETGNLVGASAEEELVLDKNIEEATVDRFRAIDSSNSIISTTTQFLINQYNGDLANIPKHKNIQRTKAGKRYLDYYRKNVDGWDLLVVNSSPVINYIWESLLFGFLILGFLLIVIVMNFILGVALAICIHREFSKLTKSFQKIEFGLKFDEIDYQSFSLIYDISKIQRQFYFLVKKLQTYSAFLPKTVLQKERMILSSSAGSSHSSQSSSHQPSKNSKNEDDHLIIERSVKTGVHQYSSSSSSSSSHSSSSSGDDSSDEISNDSGSYGGNDVDDEKNGTKRQQKQLSISTKRRTIPRNQFMAISRNAFSQFLNTKDVTLVCFHLAFKGKYSEFLYYHTKFCSILIESFLKTKYSGSIVEIGKERIIVGFNTTIPSKFHFKESILFCAECLEVAEDELRGFISVHGSCVTGVATVGILGAESEKKEVVLGSVVEKCSLLAVHARRLDAGMLVNETCAEEWNLLSESIRENYKMTTKDFVYFPSSKDHLEEEEEEELHHHMERVFEIELWRRRRRRLDGKEEEIEGFWRLLEKGKIEELRKKMKKKQGERGFEDLERILSSTQFRNEKEEEEEEMKKKNRFHERTKGCIKEKKKAFQKVNNLSVFV